jgi:hypothetical protein
MPAGCSDKDGATTAAGKKPSTPVGGTTLPCQCPTKVEFKEHGTNYGFDDRTDSTVPWKSVEKGKSDTVKAQITPPDRASKAEFVSVSPDKVTVSPATASTDNQIVTVSGVDNGTSEVQSTCGGNILGKMQVKTYTKKTKTVAVMLVNEKSYNSTDITDQKIKDYLEKVYKQAVFEFKVTRLPAKTVEFDKNKDGKVDVNSWMSDEMKAIRDACKDDGYDHNIFLVDNPSDNSLGFMDFNQRYGFVHADKALNPELSFSHEIGHGGFGLRHTPGDSDNIMYNFYSPAMWRLRKDQWDIINP